MQNAFGSRIQSDENMDHIITVVRPYLEGLYFLSSIFLVGVLGLTFRQLQLLKKDGEDRNRRAAQEKAVDASARYLNIFVPLSAKESNFREEHNLKYYKGEIGDFTHIKSIPECLKQIDNEKIFKEFVSLSNASQNELELISAMFTTGAADEATGFSIIGRSFCNSVEIYYDLICMVRTDAAQPHRDNIVKLYKKWRPRLKYAELDASMEQILKQKMALKI